MPDTSAMGMLCTRQGEATMRAEDYRRKAAKLKRDLDYYEREIARWEQEASWLGEAIASMEKAHA